MALFCVSPAGMSLADSTWNLDPLSSTWESRANWTPANVPNGTETANFELSNKTDIAILDRVNLEAMTFKPGATAYHFVVRQFAVLDFEKAGIVNDSGIVQNFTAVGTEDEIFNTHIYFFGTATAGNLTRFTSEGRKVLGGSSAGSGVDFFEDSSAGEGIFINEATPAANFYGGGHVSFSDNSTAGAAVFDNLGGIISGGGGGRMSFVSFSSADNATITAEGGTVDGAYGGEVNFLDDSHAGTSTVLVEGGRRRAPAAASSRLTVSPPGRMPPSPQTEASRGAVQAVCSNSAPRPETRPSLPTAGLVERRAARF